MSASPEKALRNAINIAGNQKVIKEALELTLSKMKAAFEKKTATLRSNIAESREIYARAIGNVVTLAEENPQLFGVDGFGTYSTGKFSCVRSRASNGKIVPVDDDKTEGMVADEIINDLKRTPEYDRCATQASRRYLKLEPKLDKKALNADLASGDLSMSKGAELGWKLVKNPKVDLYSNEEMATVKANAVE